MKSIKNRSLFIAMLSAFALSSCQDMPRVDDSLGSVSDTSSSAQSVTCSGGTSVPETSSSEFPQASVREMDNGVIVISTQETEGAVRICVSDNGTGNPEQSKTIKSTGIGLSNTRQRLSLQCGGTLETEQTDSGMFVTITIPREVNA